MIYIGIDLGGTNIAAGVVDEAGRILYKASTPTLVGREYDAILDDMAKLVEKVTKDAGFTMADVEYVGIGSPGAIDFKKGEVVFANNLFWHHVPVGEYLGRRFGKPVYVENDANVAGLAELVYGGAKGHRDAILITLGTGVGGGIIIDGHIFAGRHGVGAEIGHLCIDINGEECTCGNSGCWERYASATALINMGRREVDENPNGAIAKAVGGYPDNVTAKIVIDAAKAGDPSALKLFDRYIYALTMGIISLINLFDPEVFVIGGGVAAAGDFLLEALRKKVEEHIFYKELPHGFINLAQLGNDAGIVGAALLGRQGAVSV